MNPVRLVCESCLQSVELVPDLQGRWPTACPVCRQPLDSQLSEVSTPETHAPHSPPTVDRAPGSRAAQQRNRAGWSEVWERGSHGTFARFQLVEILGEGAFGIVHKAFDPRLDRHVALKVLKNRDPGERVKERFFREARAAARLHHPHIAEVHDSGCEDGYCWVAYHYVPGPTLHRWLARQGRPELAATVRVVAEVARALEHSHGRGIFHRDLKPSNIIIEKGKGKAVLIDFGLSRFDDVESDLTHDNAVVGTPQYMPPEQRQGRSREADARSDIYSLGVIFYEMLCGQNPSGEPSANRPWQQGDAAAPAIAPPRSLNPAIPATLEAACMKALAPQPADRYPNAGALAAELEGWLASRNRPERASPLATNAVMAIGGALLLSVALMFTAAAPYLGGTPFSAGSLAAGTIAEPKPLAATVRPATPPAETAPAAAAPAGLRSSSPAGRVSPTSTKRIREPSRVASTDHEATPGEGSIHYYRTPSGKSYHLYSDCPHTRGKVREITAAEARTLNDCADCTKQAQEELRAREAAIRPH